MLIMHAVRFVSVVGKMQSRLSQRFLAILWLPRIAAVCPVPTSAATSLVLSLHCMHGSLLERCLHNQTASLFLSREVAFSTHTKEFDSFRPDSGSRFSVGFYCLVRFFEVAPR